MNKAFEQLENFAKLKEPARFTIAPKGRQIAFMCRIERGRDDQVVDFLYPVRDGESVEDVMAALHRYSIELLPEATVCMLGGKLLIDNLK